ncbi:hypothetical protein C8J57DRAFT_1580707 [Mycena rebaudengoi]|nr:hypothetical protein C8J57DRAFT_1580707 [Mycena rebaudengoi]
MRVDQIRYLRAHLRATISELDARILVLENSLVAARCERGKLQSRLADYKYPAPSPVFLGQICRQWRDITLGTPRLWSAIEIKMHSDIPDLFSACVDLLQTWLAQSKTCPLSLSIPIGLTPDDFSHSLRHLTDTILMHSARLQYANLSIPFDHLHWSGLQGPFPLLRDLTLGASDYNVPEDAGTAFCDAPTLTTIHLVDFSTSQVALPWSQFTAISVEGWEPLQVARILRHAVSLISFGGTVWDDFDDVDLQVS